MKFTLKLQQHLVQEKTVVVDAPDAEEAFDAGMEMMLLDDEQKGWENLHTESYTIQEAKDKDGKHLQIPAVYTGGAF